MALTRALDPYRPPRRLRTPRVLWEAAEAQHERLVGPLSLGRGKVLSRALADLWGRVEALVARHYRTLRMTLSDAERAVVRAIQRHAGRFGTVEDWARAVSARLTRELRTALPSPEEPPRDRLDQLRAQARELTRRRTAGIPS